MAIRVNNGGFIAKAGEVHGERYDYSLAVYKSSREKVLIKCPEHGIFEQAPHKHLSGQGCPRCARELFKYNQMTTESFFEKAKKIYGDRYDYSLVDYKRSSIKVKIVCPKHGMFETSPNNHLRDMGNCPVCSEKSRADKHRYDTQEFIDMAIRIHNNKYDYSKVDYTGCFSEIKIICPTHGEFLQTPSVHLSGKGCRGCSDDKHRSNLQEFLKKAKEVHGGRYDYSMVDYSITRNKIKIICPKHGIFEQTAANHLKGQGCPTCLESQGEQKIVKFLESNHIEYKREKSFENCRNKKPLFFDFYIPKLNTCIEYDGRHHYSPVDYFGGKPTFEQMVRSDSIKNAFCSANGIKLIRIPYTKRDPEIVHILKRDLGLI
jgi:hypothetical protein